MKSKVVLVVIVVVLVVAAFAGGALVGPRLLPGALGGRVIAAGPGGAVGPFGQLSDAERTQLQNMSDTERQQYMQDKFGSQAPNGRGRGLGGAALIEGEILDVATDSISVKTSNGGSQTIYTDSDTVIGYVKGSEAADLAKGMTVVVATEREADGVSSAKFVLVK